MNTLGDALNESFATDAARENTLDARRAIGAIGRRRAARAAGMGTAAAVGIGAVGAVWWLGPGGRFANPAQSAPSTQCTDAQLYLPANPDALGDTDFLYRAYIDLRPDSPTHGVVVVRKDGTRVRVEPGADNSYTYLGRANVFADMPDDLRFRPMVEDNFEGGGGGDVWDGVSPVTEDYEWTIDVPAGAPAGIDTVQLSSSLRVGMGLGGAGYDASYVPEGAVTDEIVTTTDGETQINRVAYGGPSNSTDTASDVASVALQVSKLPDGGTYTITATHHAVDPALTACAPASSSSVTATPTGTPSPATTRVLPASSPDPGVSMGGVPEVLAGPESEVFACGEALPADLEGTLGLDVTWEAGAGEVGGSDSEQFDFGGGGFRASGTLPIGGAPQGEVDAANWASSFDDDHSLAVYDTAVAVQDGVIVGVVPPSHASYPTETAYSGVMSGGTEWWSVAIASVDERMTPCPGYVESELEGAQPVMLLGAGRVGGPYTFAWTEVPRS